MRTVNDLIKELQNLSPEYRDLPVVVQAENGMIFKAYIKFIFDGDGASHLPGDPPVKVIITHR